MLIQHLNSPTFNLAVLITAQYLSVLPLTCNVEGQGSTEMILIVPKIGNGNESDPNDMSAKSQPTKGGLLADCWLTVDQHNNQMTSH